MPTLSEPTTQAIPTTHCSKCGREINGTQPRVCCGCMTSAEKATGEYGPGYAAVLGDRAAREE